MRPGSDARPKTTPLPDLVGPVEIAERLGVERATVDKWRQRRVLPDPAATISGSPIWKWGEIVEWASRTGRR